MENIHFPSTVEKVAEKVWSATKWVTIEEKEGRRRAKEGGLLLDALRSATRGRTTTWWRNIRARKTRDDPKNHMERRHKWEGSKTEELPGLSRW